MIKLYFDEDVPEGVAVGLRLRGYDVKTAREAGRKGLSDKGQIGYAVSERRVLWELLQGSTRYTPMLEERRGFVVEEASSRAQEYLFGPS